MSEKFIRFREYRCSNCDGYESGECEVYVNGSGVCKWCAARITRKFGWLIPPRPGNPLTALLYSYVVVFGLMILTMRLWGP